MKSDKLTVQDLAMFIGGKVQYKEKQYDLIITSLSNGRNEAQQDVVIGNLDDDTNDRDFPVDISLVKPILRPLSDITEEEFKEYGEITGLNPSDFIGSSPDWIKISSRGLKYLISKHFDVFSWIEKGLAIDKTKI